MSARRDRFYLAAALVGALAGLIGAAFHALLEAAIAGRASLQPWLAGLPVPGWVVLMGSGALCLNAGLWLVRRFAPETAGSGIQEVETILDTRQPLRWRQVLPVKFLAGLLAIGPGLALGREGPTVHMGAAVGQMVSDHLSNRPGHSRALVAAGAAAGLAAAFNAPLAAIIFVTEELREQFDYRFTTLQGVTLASATAVIVSEGLLGQGPELPIPAPAPNSVKMAGLPLYLMLGIVTGLIGVLFNRLVIAGVRHVRSMSGLQHHALAVLAGLMLGGLVWYLPMATGEGDALVETLLRDRMALTVMVGLLMVRLAATIGSYSLGLPGGIFAPMLALGALVGAAFAGLATLALPVIEITPTTAALAAMGALFAATVRAPLTGIVLVLELTASVTFALPIIVACLTATFTAEALGGQPIYNALRELRQQAS